MPVNQAMAIAFKDALVRIGPGINRTEATRACSVHFTLSHPRNFHFSLSGYSYQGFAILDKGVNATVYNTHHFSSIDGAVYSAKTTKVGDSTWAKGKTFAEEHALSASSRIWSNCGTTSPFTLNMRIMLAAANNSNASGSLSLQTDPDSNMPFLQGFRLSWQECR